MKSLSHQGICLFFSLLFVSSNTFASSIVTTIKPLYSLVYHLTKGIDEPALMLQQNQSPHHYTLRPSDYRLLADAQMIIWIGPEMESYLNKVISQQKSHATIVTALQAKGLIRLEMRAAHDHGGHHHHAETHSDYLDPHIWLSTDNTIAISQHISQQLIAFNPEKTEQYKRNLDALIEKIEQTRRSIENRLKTRTDTRADKGGMAYIPYHDAFQYFEKDNALIYIDSINRSDETGTSLKHLLTIKKLIAEKDIQCLVYQAPRPAVINTLTQNIPIKTVELDPLGTNVENDEEAWFELMRSLSTGFSSCHN